MPSSGKPYPCRDRHCCELRRWTACRNYPLLPLSGNGLLSRRGTSGGMPLVEPALPAATSARSKRVGRSGHTAASVRKQPRPLVHSREPLLSHSTIRRRWKRIFSGGHRNMGRMKSEPIRAARGVYGAVATPRVADSIEVDPAALFDYLDAIAQAGVDGIVLFGSTGEFVHFEVADRMRVATLAIK